MSGRLFEPVEEAPDLLADGVAATAIEAREDADEEDGQAEFRHVVSCRWSLAQRDGSVALRIDGAGDWSNRLLPVSVDGLEEEGAVRGSVLRDRGAYVLTGGLRPPLDCLVGPRVCAPPDVAEGGDGSG